MSTGPHMNIFMSQVGHFGQAQPSLNHEQQPSVITAARPSIQVWRSQQSIGFRSGQIMNLLVNTTLARDGQYPLDRLGLGRHFECGIAEERANGCEPKISTARPDPPPVLQVVQESADQRGVN